eukprot:7057804-Pyramimonas_sp.AAC.1
MASSSDHPMFTLIRGLYIVGVEALGRLRLTKLPPPLVCAGVGYWEDEEDEKECGPKEVRAGEMVGVE